MGLAVTLSVGLTGCTLGQSSSFTGRADASCRQASDDISKASPTADPVTMLGDALDRYTDVERVVSEIASDVSFPGGARGRTLRSDWLEPARRSLRTGRDDLDTLRAAVRTGDRTEQATAYHAALTAGTVGVKPASLQALDLPSCAALFAAPAAK
ncbi:MAG: hypothetical protein JWM76_4395 [Pseudonocardiales bacterium]|nr:hypothetical protein [Pseudonocardiales bacterium]